MSDEFDLDDENLSGSALRKKLEQAIEQNRDLRSKVASFEATEVIGRLGLKNVTAADLVGVAPKDLEAKAQEVEAQKAAEKENILKAALVDRGLNADQIESALAALTDPKGLALSEQIGRAADLVRAGGTPVPKTETEGLSGPALIMAGVEARSKARKS